MQINMGQPQQNSQPQGQAPVEGGTFIDWNNMKRESERLDKDGNVIDPRTKRIIRRNSDPTS